MILAPPRFDLPVYAWQLEALAFFDHILRGAHNGYASQPPVRYWLDGADCYASAPGFPIPGSIPARFHLASAGSDHAVHRLSPEVPPEGTNSWAAVPIGVPVVGGFDEVANQTLTYELAMDIDVEFSGPVSAHLKFSCNEINSYVVTRLGRVDGKGGYHLLSMGVMSPARRTDRSNPQYRLRDRHRHGGAGAADTR